MGGNQIQIIYNLRIVDSKSYAYISRKVTHFRVFAKSAKKKLKSFFTVFIFFTFFAEICKSAQKVICQWAIAFFKGIDDKDWLRI